MPLPELSIANDAAGLKGHCPLVTRLGLWITDRYWLSLQSLGQGSLFRQSIDTARGSCSLWRGAAGRSRGWRGAGGRSRTRTGTAAARGTTEGASVERRRAISRVSQLCGLLI